MQSLLGLRLGSHSRLQQAPFVVATLLRKSFASVQAHRKTNAAVASVAGFECHVLPVNVRVSLADGGPSPVHRLGWDTWYGTVVLKKSGRFRYVVLIQVDIQVHGVLAGCDTAASEQLVPDIGGGRGGA